MTVKGAPAARVLPVPTPETKMYWDMAAKHELWLPKCVDTGRFFFPPRESSPFTGGAISWACASGRAKLASFVIAHRPAPGYEDVAPYVIALAELEEGPRLACNLLNVAADPAALKIGMPLEVTFEDRGPVSLPQFQPAHEGPR